ncbi:MAG: type II secretion system F family protein [bacterium]|nr:type II secretion system F family protein [bacterium]
MNSAVISKLIIEIIICIIFVICAFLFVRIFYQVKNIKRIENFSISKNNINENSIYDKLYKFFVKLLKKISKYTKKSYFLSNYAKKLDKYLIYNKNKNITSNDFISLKIVYMLFVLILYFITCIIRIVNINLFVSLLICILSFFIIDIIIYIVYKNKRNTIESGLLQAVVIMNSAFKSGKNIYQAINIVRTSLSSPIKEEFDIIAKDLNYGLDLTTVFSRFYDRVKVDEIKYITSSLSLLNKTGGNIVSVFNMIEKHFYDKLKIKNELSSLTSSSKMLYRILTLVPFIFVIVIVTLNPTYFNPLITTKIGLVLDIIMLLMYVIYIIIIKKVLKVEKI